MFQDRNEKLTNNGRKFSFVGVCYLFLLAVTAGLVFEVWITPGYAYNRLTPRHLHAGKDLHSAPMSQDPYEQLLENVELPEFPETPIDTMPLHWSRLAELSSAERRTFAADLESLQQNEQRLDDAYTREYGFSISQRVYQMKPLIAQLTANPPDLPQSQELMQSIQTRWQKLEAEDRASASTFEDPPPTPSNLALAEDNLLKDRVTLADLETIRLHKQHLTDRNNFVRSQKAQLELLKADLRDAIRVEKEADTRYDKLVPAGLPPFNAQDPYQYLDPRYKAAYEAYAQAKQRKPATGLRSGTTVEELLDMQPGNELPPRKSGERAFSPHTARQVLDDAIWDRRVTRITLKAAFGDARYREDIEAVEREYAAFHNTTGKPEDYRNLKSDLLERVVPVTSYMNYNPNEVDEVRHAIDSIFALPAYWKK